VATSSTTHRGRDDRAAAARRFCAGEIAENDSVSSRSGTNEPYPDHPTASAATIPAGCPDRLHRQGIFERDPFRLARSEGVGQLVRMGAERGRATRADIKLGICGEHGGDPASIAFFDAAGLDYVSCSPYRVPIARLAAARAALEGKAESDR